ncbi:hypothetical protein TYRP_015346 [Tyrophagus putrescentiae]|nr:hypothetical protein TYRP_015346 [Tyrophagus putrescentiae]
MTPQRTLPLCTPIRMSTKLYSKLYSSVYLPNRLYHQQAHLDAVNGVIGPGDGQSADAVLIKAPKKVIQRAHQLR